MKKRAILRRACVDVLESRTLLSTYYLSPSGSDSASGSATAPFATFSRAYQSMHGGDTLIVKSGTYNRQQVLTGNVAPPAGSASAYTRIVAETDDAAIIDCQGVSDAVQVAGPSSSPIQYIEIRGLVFRHQMTGAGVWGVNHVKFIRDGFEDAGDGNNNTFGISANSSDILVEECFAWGSGRYKFSTYHANRVVFRRDVARYDRVNADGYPCAAFSFYASDSVEAQNCISIDGDKSQFWNNVGEYSGSFYIPTTDGTSSNINITGCLALNVDMQFGSLTADLDNVNISNSVGWHIRDGVWARDSAAYDHMTFGDLYGPGLGVSEVGMAWAEGRLNHPNTTSITNSLLYKISGTALTSWNSEDYNDFYGNVANRAGGTPTGAHSYSANPNLQYILRVESNNSALHGKASDGGDVGATVVKQIGVSGTLWGEAGYNTVTGTDLWPFPNEDNIRNLMRSYQYSDATGTLSGARGFAADGQTLTNYVWTYLGNANPYSTVQVAPVSPTYYVSPGGSDSNAGTDALPWKTLQHAADLVKAGDTVIVRAGTYSSGFWLGTSGTSSAPITFKADPGATITGKNPTTADGIDLEGASYVVVDGFTINNAGSNITRADIRAVTNDHVTIQNNMVSNAGQWGIYTSHSDYDVIQYNISHDNNFGTGETWNHHGIYVSNSAVNPTLRGNTIYNNWGNGLHMNGDASQGGTGMVTGALVEGNTIYNNGVNGGSAINCDGVMNSTFRNNLLYGNHAKGLALYTINAAAGSTSNVVANNTIVQASGAGAALTLKDGATGCTLRNNILIGSVPEDIYSDSSSGLTDTNKITTDTSSLFANEAGNDFHLKSGSPAIDAGTSSNAPSTDHDGVTRPQGAGYDIGAFEFAGATVTVPAAPSGLGATAMSPSQINLTWVDNATNETGFKIERATGSGAFAQIAAVGAGVTSYSDTGLAASTNYSYRVRATNSAGDSAYSSTASATTQAAATVPAAPSNLVATANALVQINLTWTDNATNETGFKIERMVLGGLFTQVATVGAGVTSYTDTALLPSLLYSYRIRATNAVGDSAYSNTASATTSAAPTIPNDPSNLAAAAVSSTQVNLTWTDNATNEAGFKIERATGTGAFVEIATVGTDVSSYSDTTVSGSTQYSYRVRATNSTGDSAYSNTATVTMPATPTVPISPNNLAATGALGQINLTWSDNSNNETNFRIDRAADGMNYSQIATLGANVTSYVDANVSVGTTYTYRIRAYNSVGNSVWSNLASGTPLALAVPAAPSALSATAAGANQVNLSWTDNATNETGFKIERATGSGSFSQIATVGAAVTTFADTGLSESTQYTYRVRATSAAGDSAYSNTSAVTTPATIPAAPSGLTATVISAGQIDLSWTDNAGNETGFKIERATGTGAFAQIATVGAGVTTFSNTGLAESTQYTYRVRATNSAGDSAYSGTATATTPATIPTAPSGLTTAPASAAEIDLAWNDNSSNETGFKVERSTGAGSFVQIATVGSGVTGYSDTGLSESTSYTYRVRATDSAGDSAYSNSATGATPATIPLAPSGLAAGVVSASEIDLSWLDNSFNETGFKIERASGGGGFVQIATVGAGVTTFASTGLSESTSYSYRVRATDSAGDSAFSNIAGGQTRATIPLAPSGLDATVSDAHEIDLTWTDNSINETGFRIERATGSGSFAQIATVAAGVTSYADAGLSESTGYSYRVRATDSAGDSLYSNTAAATTPATIPLAPSNAAAAALDPYTVVVTWTDNSFNETGFTIERSLDGTTWNVAGTVTANIVNFTDTGLTENTGYSYRVRAGDSAGDSAYSSVATAQTPYSVPNAPTDLAATAVGSSEIDLTWTDKSCNESGFKVERSTNGGAFVRIGTIWGDNVGFNDTNVVETSTYSYRVSATNPAGDSLASNVATATPLATLPATPSNLVATAATASRITLSWADNSFNETGFKIQRSTDGVAWTDVTTAAAGATWYLDSGLTPGVTYLYRVAATNSAGDSAWSNTSSAVTYSTAPDAPSNLTINGVDYTQIALSWQDNSVSEYIFKIERSTNGGAFVQIATVGTDVTSFVDTGLTPKNSYSYRVRATNVVGDSAYSNTATASTLADTAAPTATLQAPNLTTGGSAIYTFTVTYFDNVAVDTATLNSRNISVTGPKGYKQTATLKSYVAGTTPGSIIATYYIIAPHKIWTSKDNGLYKVTLQSNQVLDSSGNVAPSVVLGYFSISISSLTAAMASDPLTLSADPTVI